MDRDRQEWGKVKESIRLTLSHHSQRLATYGPLVLLVVHMLLFFIVACIAAPFPKTPATAAGEDSEDRACEEDQIAREHGDATTHDDSEGNKMVELQSRGEFSSSSSSTQPPLYGK
jgi:hypothetical protein